MNYVLRDQVTFCAIGRRLIFLDLAADRYFALTDTFERSFFKLVESGLLAAEDRANLAAMAGDGLLLEASGEPAPKACPTPPADTASLLDRSLPRPSAPGVVRSLTAFARIRMALACSGLGRVVRAIAAGKLRLSDHAGRHAQPVEQVLAEFLGAERFVGRFDGCLWYSLALAGSLLKAGHQPTVVFGVQLGPFAAHCWIQNGSRLVNDRFDFVRNFTPILVI